MNNISQVPKFPKCKPDSPAPVSSSGAAVNQTVALPSSDVVNNVPPPPPLQIEQDIVKNNTPR